jgi:hypothetical protein
VSGLRRKREWAVNALFSAVKSGKQPGSAGHSFGILCFSFAVSGFSFRWPERPIEWDAWNDEPEPRTLNEMQRGKN